MNNATNATTDHQALPTHHHRPRPSTRCRSAFLAGGFQAGFWALGAIAVVIAMLNRREGVGRGVGGVGGGGGGGGGGGRGGGGGGGGGICRLERN